MKPVLWVIENRRLAPRAGALPCAVLILATTILLFGTGPSAASPVLQTLYAFGANPKNPDAGLVQGNDGNFYGTTGFGGTSGENGTIYRIGSDGGLTVLFSFNGNNGSQPQGRLVQGMAGGLYGTASFGGTNGDHGTVFRFTLSGQFTLLFSFKGTNGSHPHGGLIQGTDGGFYGTTIAGGVSTDNGTIFKITSNGVFTLLYSFPSNGRNGSSPMASLFQHSDGNFYGTTAFGGATSDNGTVFRITPAGAFTSLLSFNGANGSSPVAGLVRGSDGNFYGTTQFGGSADSGTIFRVTSSGTLTSLLSFSATNGSYPVAPLLAGSDGRFYGTTAGDSAAVTNKFGTAFAATSAGALTTLLFFNSTNGSSPVSGFAQGSDGNYYSTSFESGPGGGGTVFRLVEPPVLSVSRPAPGSLALSWSAFSNGLYRLEFKQSLSTGTWNPLTADIRATTNRVAFTDNPGATPLRFYRVRLLP